MQWDRRSYRDHLLREHNEVSRRGFDVPVRFKGRELAAVWVSVHRHQVSSTTLAAQRREELGLPHILDREAERRLHDNRARLALTTQGRGPCQRGGAGRPRYTASGNTRAGGVIATKLGTFQARTLAEPAGKVRL